MQVLINAKTPGATKAPESIWTRAHVPHQPAPGGSVLLSRQGIPDLIRIEKVEEREPVIIVLYIKKKLQSQLLARGDWFASREEALAEPAA